MSAEVRYFVPDDRIVVEKFIAKGLVVIQGKQAVYTSQQEQRAREHTLIPSRPQAESIEAYVEGQEAPFMSAGHTDVMDFEIARSRQVNLFSMLMFCVQAGSQDISATAVMKDDYNMDYID